MDLGRQRRSRAQRWDLLGTRGATLWLTGLSGAGKTTLAFAAEDALLRDRRFVTVIDGDDLREGLSSDLGFSLDDRTENARRASEVACLLADTGVVAIVALISPLRSLREDARRRHAERGLPFFEVFLDTPIEVCERRDPKGLYRRARQGNVALTGVSSPYEPPEHADLVLPEGDVQDSVAAVLALLPTA